MSTSVQAITEEGFLGSRILTLDGNGQRSQKLSDWLHEHEGIHFQYPSEETTKAKESTRSDDQRSTTPEMETVVRITEVCSEEDVDILDSGSRNLEKKSILNHFDGEDSTTEESISYNEAYHTESGEPVEASEETTPKGVPRGGKQKRIGTPVIDAERAVQSKSTKRAQSKRSTH